MSHKVFMIILVILSALSVPIAQSSPLGITVPLLYYNHDEGPFVFPRTGAYNTNCPENQQYGRRYAGTGTLQGPHSYGWHGYVDQPSFVTLYHDRTNEQMRIKVTPLGVRKTTSNGYSRGTFHGSTCSQFVNEWNTFFEKLYSTTGEVGVAGLLGYGPKLHYYLAFEVIDQTSRPSPGIYSARGGHQFGLDNIRVTLNSKNSNVYVAPYIHNLSVAVDHVFDISMPFTSISLMPSQQENDNYEGQVEFLAKSNERYTITMNCSGSAGSNGGCLFGGTNMELSTELYFPRQGVRVPLLADTPHVVESPDFTNSRYDYPGRLLFSLDGIATHARPGQTYTDSVTFIFEADF
jgi:hypothetical protein